MPWTKKQKKLFNAIAHGWKPKGKVKGIKLSKAKAAKMAKEPTRRKKKRKKKK
jgi:hypothetical protein